MPGGRAARHDGRMRTGADVATARAALQDQWDGLRRWVDQVGDPTLAAAPSVLDGWTVGELWAHLGRALEALTVCTPAAPGAAPLSLAEYLRSYAAHADDIAETTRRLAAEHADDPVGRSSAAQGRPSHASTRSAPATRSCRPGADRSGCRRWSSPASSSSSSTRTTCSSRSAAPAPPTPCRTPSTPARSGSWPTSCWRSSSRAAAGTSR
ncbi:hypothetical protein GC089_15765 [Cellulomonas sp. JZ18]|nr:hypothetical protein GC089_15765 [Cellulomonas sp. JZ18]